MRRRELLVAIAAMALAAVSTPFVIAEGSLHIQNRPVPQPGAANLLGRSSEATWREVSIAAQDGVKLNAWFFNPAEPNGAAVLLLHGVGDTRLGMTGHAEYLLRAGYSVLMPDSRGHGASGGDLVTYGLKEARDAADWAQWMAKQPGIDRTYALGESMGAAIAIQSLALQPGFRAVVAECPFARFQEIAVYRVSQRLPGLFAKPVTAVAEWYTRTRYGLAIMQASPVDALRRSATPVLLIHGLADTNIPPVQSRELHAANPRTTELWEVANATHVSASSEEPHEFRRRVLAWFAEH